MASHAEGPVAFPPPPELTGKFDSASVEENAAAHNNNNLQVDTDGDSAIGDLESISSSTVSLRSSIFETVEENGRSYHKFVPTYKEGSYLLPNDDKEQARLDLQHHLCKLTLRGKSHLAPLKPDIRNVLDFGTGTGIWAVEFAEEYPNASVLGTDLSPIQPVHLPVNCRFEVSDASDEWYFFEKFDYIHGRLLATCFSDPAFVFTQAFHSLSPGGYFEMFDFNASFSCIDSSDQGTAIGRYKDLMLEGAKKLGRDFTHAPKYRRYFDEAGFVDVVEEKLQWPFNTWPKGRYFKELGRWYNEDLNQGLEGITMATLTRAFGWKKDEVAEFCKEVRKDLDDTNIHAYLPIYVVYGRRPEAG